MSAEATTEAEGVCYTIRGFRVLIKNDFKVQRSIGVHIEAKKEASKRPWVFGISISNSAFAHPTGSRPFPGVIDGLILPLIWVLFCMTPPDPKSLVADFCFVKRGGICDIHSHSGIVIGIVRSSLLCLVDSG